MSVEINFPIKGDRMSLRSKTSLAGLAGVGVLLTLVLIALSNSTSAAAHVSIADLSAISQKSLAAFGVSDSLTIEGTAGERTFFAGSDDEGNECRMIGRSPRQVDAIFCASPGNPLTGNGRAALIIPSSYAPSAPDGQPDASRERLLGIWGFARPDIKAVRLINDDGDTQTIVASRGLFGTSTPLADATAIEAVNDAGAVVQEMKLG